MPKDLAGHFCHPSQYTAVPPIRAKGAFYSSHHPRGSTVLCGSRDTIAMVAASPGAARRRPASMYFGFAFLYLLALGFYSLAWVFLPEIPDILVEVRVVRPNNAIAGCRPAPLERLVNSPR